MLTPLPCKTKQLRRAILAFLLTYAQLARATSWYVDKSATGLHTGRSRSDAWTTLASIDQTLLRPGDVVLISPATYDEHIAIRCNGVPSSRITLKGIESPIIRGIDLDSSQYIAIIGFDIFQGSANYDYPGIRMAGAKGCLFQDNYIHGISQGNVGILGAFNSINNYNIVRANRFQDIGLVPLSVRLGINILIHGNYNVIEYNSFGRGDDRTNLFGQFNIIRNNYMGPMLQADIPGVDPHIDDFQSYSGTAPLFDTVLFERNFSVRNDSGNAHMFFIRNTAGGHMRHFISRLNVAFKTGSFVSQLENIDDAWIYNNTFVDLQDRAPVGEKSSFAAVVNGRFPSLSHWFNNSFTRASRDNGRPILNVSQNAVVDQDYNHTFLSGVALGKHSINRLDARFRDEVQLDFHLQPTSPLIGKGQGITIAKGSGNSSMGLTVQNAGALCDGWTVADGDIISVGSGAYVGIVSVDYESHMITLAEPRTWRDGDRIFLKGGTDIGGLPFKFAAIFSVNNTTPPVLPCGFVTLSATVMNPDSVRKVEFLVDGIPVSSVYESPYSITWQSDGGYHRVEARAYAAWASETLYRSSFNSH